LGAKNIGNKENLSLETFKSIYKQYFKTFVDQELVFGEITPAYSMLNEEGYRYILDIYPEAKFIFLLRNPVDRYWSQLRMAVKEHRRDISWALSSFEEKLNDNRYVLRTDYLRTLKELEKVVPSSQILVIFYENLFSQAKGNKEVKKITDFLEIDYRSPHLDTYIHKGLNAELNLNLRLQAIHRFKHVYFGIYRRFTSTLPESWWNDIKLLNPDTPSKTMIVHQDLKKSHSKLANLKRELSLLVFSIAVFCSL
jgi:hypothetical protein